MHCPSCGQQQVSNETKFCSRCGLPLGLLSEVLSHGGFLPQLAELNKTNHTLYTRKNGVVFSVFWFIFWVPILTWMFGGVFGAETLAGITALIGVFGALMLFIFSLVYLKGAPKYIYPNEVRTMPYSPGHALPGQPAAFELPPQQSIPASAYNAPRAGSWRDTNDLQNAGSITESTTRLLSEEDSK